MIYKWKEGARVNLEPEIAGQELERLRIKHNGRLTPDAVVKAAKVKASPLHDEFDWDDEPHYTSLAVAMSDKDLRQQVLERAWREFQSWRKRYADLKELVPLFDVADDTAKELSLKN